MIHYRLRASYQDYLETIRREKAEAPTECEHEYSAVVYDGILRNPYRMCEHCGDEVEVEES
jgi:hypothetical protein